MCVCVCVSECITVVCPRIRYDFRVRAIDESGRPSGWSEALSVETDAADSAHRIAFEEIECFEVLGEGAFSVVHCGKYRGQVCGYVEIGVKMDR